MESAEKAEQANRAKTEFLQRMRPRYPHADQRHSRYD